jgi:hypothetical protein
MVMVIGRVKRAKPGGGEGRSGVVVVGWDFTMKNGDLMDSTSEFRWSSNQHATRCVDDPTTTTGSALRATPVAVLVVLVPDFGLSAAPREWRRLRVTNGRSRVLHQEMKNSHDYRR